MDWHQAQYIAQEAACAYQEMARPSVIFKARLRYHGIEHYSASYGEFSVTGATPDEAMRKFDQYWIKKDKTS